MSLSQHQTELRPPTPKDGASIWTDVAQSVVMIVAMGVLLFVATSTLGGKPDQKLSMLAVITGLSVAMTWCYLGWHSTVYEGMAGIIAGLIILSLPLLINRKQRNTSRHHS